MNDTGKDNVASISQNMGERLTMFYLYHYLNCDVEYVDYVGADLIAINRNDKTRYAISVKTRKMSEKWEDDKAILESRSVTSFRDKDAKFLRCFADDMKMEALVAYVIVFQRNNKKRGYNSILLFLIGLDDLEDMRNDENIRYVEMHIQGNKQDSGFSLRFGGKNDSILCQLCDDPRVTWFKMEIEDYHIADKYNLNHKNENAHLTSEYWNKQQGTFGEYLALWNLGKNHNMRGFHVDSTGADLVLFNNKENVEHYAVSVKTFTYDKSYSYQFEKANEDKLLEYSKKWSLDSTNPISMEPMICFNCVRYNENKQISTIYMMAFKISDVDKNLRGKYIYRTAGGITIHYDEVSLNAIKDDPKIIFSEIKFTNYNYYIQ